MNDCFGNVGGSGEAGWRGTNTWVILSRFKTMAYVVSVTTGITIAREERLKRESLMLQNDFYN
jgi:hypothetical protein